MERRVYREDGVFRVTNVGVRLSSVGNIHWILEWKHDAESDSSWPPKLRMICSLKNNISCPYSIMPKDWKWVRDGNYHGETVSVFCWKKQHAGVTRFIGVQEEGFS